MNAPASGLVLVDKPVGPSSFAIVRALRRRYGAKAGHAGTLDPLASGLLLVLLGGATRLARYLVGLDKRYVTEIRLGERTSTGDAEGEVVERPAIPADVPASVAALEGEVERERPRTRHRVREGWPFGSTFIHQPRSGDFGARAKSISPSSASGPPSTTAQ